MGTKREQSQCRDCEYIWYPREKKDPCPKCKSANVAYTGGLGRLVLIVFLLGLVGAAVFAGLYFKDMLRGGDPVVENRQVTDDEQREPPKEPSERGEQTPAPEGPGDQPGDENPASPEPLTGQRTWTSKNGRALEAKLLSLSLVEGQFVGVFERPDGETFNYKIGNLSKPDVDLVKGIVGRE